MVILILFSILSGVVTVLSPCILPILPIVLSSATASGKSRPLGVITGLIISFSIFTLAISKIVSLLGLSANALRLAAVVFIGILGLSMVVPSLNTWVEKLFSFFPRLVPQRSEQGSGFGAGFLTGAGLGLIWAPCAGPILAAVTTLAATQSISFGAVLVVVSYAIGAGIPLLGITYGGRALINRVPVLMRNLLRIQQAFGVVMIITAVLIAFNVDTLVTAWVTDMVPASWTASLNSFESNQAVSNQLNEINPGNNPAGSNASTQTGQGSNQGGTSSSVSMDLPNLGPAPEITGITNWINSNPLTLKDLRGKVVLIDFWTYSCINCIRTLPYLTDWYSKYQVDGLVIIGVHSPEFAFEHDTANVEAAVKRFNITYPVAQDNDFATWQAYNNRYWPAEYIIDVNGNLRHTHFGEGSYDETEKIIQELLAEAGNPANLALTDKPTAQFSSMQTPETYVGYGRQSDFASPENVVRSAPSSYTIPDNLPLHEFAISGTWDIEDQFAQSTQSGDMLALHFFAKDAYLVMSSDQTVPVKVELQSPNVPNQSEDVNSDGYIMVKDARLYHLAGLDKAGEGSLTLHFDQPGVRVYAFTFGS